MKQRKFSFAGGWGEYRFRDGNCRKVIIKLMKDGYQVDQLVLRSGQR